MFQNKMTRYLKRTDSTGFDTQEHRITCHYYITEILSIMYSWNSIKLMKIIDKHSSHFWQTFHENYVDKRASDYLVRCLSVCIATSDILYTAFPLDLQTILPANCCFSSLEGLSVSYTSPYWRPCVTSNGKKMSSVTYTLKHAASIWRSTVPIFFNVTLKCKQI